MSRARPGGIAADSSPSPQHAPSDSARPLPSHHVPQPAVDSDTIRAQFSTGTIGPRRDPAMGFPRHDAAARGCCGVGGAGSGSQVGR
jgi:hypothetical protein